MSVARLNKTGLFKKIPPPTEDTRVEILLWRAALDKALLDIFDEEEEHRHDAKSWLDINNPDFVTTCEIAMLEPETVYKMFLTVKYLFITKGEDHYSNEDCRYNFNKDQQ